MEAPSPSIPTLCFIGEQAALAQMTADGWPTFEAGIAMEATQKAVYNTIF